MSQDDAGNFGDPVEANEPIDPEPSGKSAAEEAAPEITPETSGAELATIAYTQPELRVQVASHPNAYPGLLDWLRQYGDDEVKAAIDARPISTVPFMESATVIQPTAMVMGVPKPPRPPVPPLIRVLIIAVALALVVAAVVTGGVLLLKSRSGGSEGPDVIASSQVSPTIRTQEPSTTQPQAPDTPETPATSSQDQTLASIKAEVAQDTLVAEANLVGWWTPQLSAKYNGIKLSDKTWHYADIWDQFLGFKQLYPSALLLHAKDWSNLGLSASKWYVMMAGVSFSGPKATNRWCYDEGYTPDNCFAVKLGHGVAKGTEKHWSPKDFGG